jgi:GNAT superfamily N-acetyltransferase
MTAAVSVRPVRPSDRAQWSPLWDGYLAFYGRAGDTALDPAVTDCTWQRFFDIYEPVHCLVAEQEGQLLGLVHFVYHRNTTIIHPTCYLHDLFTHAAARGKGVGRALIEAVYAQVRADGGDRVYWQTHETNSTAMALYDKIAEKNGFLIYRKTL